MVERYLTALVTVEMRYAGFEKARLRLLVETVVCDVHPARVAFEAPSVINGWRRK
jgi:hypothetical protein